MVENNNICPRVAAQNPFEGCPFVNGIGDIALNHPEFNRRILGILRESQPHLENTYYFQSILPHCLAYYFREFPRGSVLMTTLETNRDGGYEGMFGAPIPSLRFLDFYVLDYPRKAVIVEPVMDFDLEPFLDWMFRLQNQGSLEFVWFGFSSEPAQMQQPEPTIEKAQRFIDRLLEAGIEVRGRTLRDVVIRNLDLDR